ncbi:MAG TPA: hypothetical protein VJP79_05485 [Nitrososphaera sp.]|nr:hypothetical protein [Nitrososphaera sp.]
MRKRRPVLIKDDSQACVDAVELLGQNGIDFVEYDISKFAESCCGDLPTTKAPSIFGPEGVFKGLQGVEEYVAVVKAAKSTTPGPEQESESAYW